MDGHEINERRRFVLGQAVAAMMVSELVELGGEAGKFGRKGHKAHRVHKERQNNHQMLFCRGGSSLKMVSGMELVTRPPFGMANLP